MSRTTRRFFIIYMAVLALSVMLLGGCDVKKAEQRIAYVDMAEVISTSGLATYEKDRIEQVISTLKSTSKEAEGLYEQMEASKADAARKTDQTVLNQLLVSEQNSARMAVILQVRQAVEKVRKEEGITIVLDGATVLTADQNINLSKKVSDVLKGVKPEFGPLPDLKVNNSVAKPENNTSKE